ncbi:unnamed protein product [Arabidopsis halleri]
MGMFRSGILLRTRLRPKTFVAFVLLFFFFKVLCRVVGFCKTLATSVGFSFIDYFIALFLCVYCRGRFA